MPAQFFSGFGNEALIAVCALIMVGKSLETTGALQPLATIVIRLSDESADIERRWLQVLRFPQGWRATCDYHVARFFDCSATAVRPGLVSVRSGKDLIG